MGKVSLLVIVIFACFGFSLGKVSSKGKYQPVPANCIRCICEAESGCKPPYPSCHKEYTYLPCGPLGISYVQWEEALELNKTIGKSFEECASKRKCSERIFQAYMAKHKPKNIRYSDSKGLCEYYSKVHKGGPEGPRLAPTKAFWDKVASCLDRLELNHAEL
ncbi:lysozyme-like [Lytechinus variegatus]|uniref:lysozyme-like n=1 Tax=Lytechinus variegatus TaxID=7654 RepID=UPI001BB114A1|nr:lysozyme-like [Lytechinus variegatus]